ncbi:MAG: tol-pal system YbgF family protein [Phycisphaerae bacterium]
MQTRSISVAGFSLLVAVTTLATCGCEGINRKHDPSVINIDPPPADIDYARVAEELPNFPDLVEGMYAARQTYMEQLKALERGYLLAGDTVRANWARRQRDLTKNVLVYPYLSDDAPGRTFAVAPEESIPEADALYDKAVKLYDTFQGIPFVGFTKLNSEDCRKALGMFKRIISEYPKSDKVDDCAYYCGAIYKEFLRDDDPDNELAIRYFKWAYELDPMTPHPARFDCAVVYDFRLHNRERAIELYHQVLETEEAGNDSNQRFAATRIEQLSDDDTSHLRPREPITANRRGVSEEASPETPPATARLPETEEND